MSSAAPNSLRRRVRNNFAWLRPARKAWVRVLVVTAAVVLILVIQGSLFLGLH